MDRRGVLPSAFSMQSLSFILFGWMRSLQIHYFHETDKTHHSSSTVGTTSLDRRAQVSVWVFTIMKPTMKTLFYLQICGNANTCKLRWDYLSLSFVFTENALCGVKLCRRFSPPPLQSAVFCHGHGLADATCWHSHSGRGSPTVATAHL